MAFKPALVGGQAVISGVMMRSANFVSVAVRSKNNKIKIKSWKQPSLRLKNKVFGFPIVRGVSVLFESMIIGIKALTISANESTDKEEEKLSNKELFFTILLSLVMSVLIFKLLPLFLATFVTNNTSTTLFGFNLVEGVLKILIFVAYLWLISRMSDVKILFRYHGAEHKAVNCYEAGKKLTARNAKKFTRMQPRCGTTFIFVVLFISILVYLLVPLNIGFWEKLFWRVLLLPIIAGISYEFIRIGAKYYDHKLAKIVMAPGIAFQKLTTSEPNLKELEVACESLLKVLKKEKAPIP